MCLFAPSFTASGLARSKCFVETTESSSSTSSPNSSGGCQWKVSFGFWCFLDFLILDLRDPALEEFRFLCLCFRFAFLLLRFIGFASALVGSSLLFNCLDISAPLFESQKFSSPPDSELASPSSFSETSPTTFVFPTSESLSDSQQRDKICLFFISVRSLSIVTVAWLS